MIRKSNLVIVSIALSLFLGLYCSARADSTISGKVAHWKLDETSGSTAADSAGTNNGTLGGPSGGLPTWTTAGKINGAVVFNGLSTGNGNYINVGDTGTLATPSFTLSFWAQLNNPSGSFQGGVARGYIFGSASEYAYRMQFHGGYMSAGITCVVGTTDTSFSGSVAIGDNQWHMWTLTADNGNLRIYKDGVSSYTGTYPSSIDFTKSHNEFVIGGRITRYYAMDGKIDDVRYYNRALSAAEVTLVYNGWDNSGGVVEDFESYSNDAGLQAKWAATNATVSLETVLTHDHSKQSMQVDYNPSLSPYRSEVSYTLSATQNWTINNYRAMTLYFHGSTNNVPQPIYVTVQDEALHSATVLYDFPADLTESDLSLQWREWNIDLQEFAAGGVQLASVKKVIIGVGSGNPGGSSGTVYIDNIGLYPQRCVAEFAPEGDFNGDCRVDANDVLILVQDWLLQGEGDVTAAAPNSAGLLARYTFDETSGSTANDSSGHGYNATVNTAGLNNAWNAQGKYSGCLYFNGDYSNGAVVLVPNSVFSGLTNQVTFSAWVNVDMTHPEQMVIFDSNGILSTDNWPNPKWDESVGFETSSENVIWSEAEPQDYKGGWHHYALVKDINKGIQRIYRDGELVTENRNVEASLAGINNFLVGRSFTTDSRYGMDMYKGKLDDLRIYNYALSQAEVLNLAGVSQWHQRVLSQADAYTDAQESIDFKDFAALANQWLQQQFWPNP